MSKKLNKKRITADDIIKKSVVSEFLSLTNNRFWIRNDYEPPKAKERLDNLRLVIQKWIDVN